MTLVATSTSENYSQIFWFEQIYQQNESLSSRFFTAFFMNTYSQLYRMEFRIFTVKQVPPFRQYDAAYFGGHEYVGNAISGLGGFGDDVCLSVINVSEHQVFLTQQKYGRIEK